MASPYEIAIRISMENAVSPILAIIGKDMLGLGIGVKELEKGLNRVGVGLKAAIAGGVGLAAAFAIGKGILDVADKGQELIHQQNLMLNNGIKLNEVLDVTSKAYSDIAKNVPTANSAEILKAYSELRSVVGADAALGITPMTLKTEEILKRVTGKDSSGDGFKLWRSMEMKGIATADPELAKKIIGSMVDDIGGSMGKLSAGDFQQMAKRGGASFRRATPESILGPLAVLASDIGGDGTGTMMSTFYNFMSGANAMSLQQLKTLRAVGLIDESKVKVEKGRVVADAGAIIGSTERLNDIPGWMAFAKPYIDKEAAREAALPANKGKTQEELAGDLEAKIGRNRNVIKAFDMFTDPGFAVQIQKDIDLWRQGLGVDGRYASTLGLAPRTTAPQHLEDPAQAAEAAGSQKSLSQKYADYTAVMEGLQKQWESFMMAVGGPAAKSLIPILQNLTTSFSNMGEWANAHQEGIGQFAKVMEALAVGLAVLGGAALTAGIFALAGPGGVLLALAASMGTLVAVFNNTPIADLVTGLGSAFNGLFSMLRGFVNRVRGLVGLEPLDEYKAQPPPLAPGRDVHSPSTGEWAYTPAATPVIPDGIRAPKPYDPLSSIPRPPIFVPPALAAQYASPGPLPVKIVDMVPTGNVHLGRDVRSPQTGPYAYTPAPAPIVNVAAPQVDTKVDVKVTASLDGIISQLAAKIERMVENSIRIPNSSAGTDGRANHMSPDSYNF